MGLPGRVALIAMGLFCFILLMVLTSIGFHVFSSVRSSVSDRFAPALSVFVVPVQDFFDSINNRIEYMGLREENESLREDNQRLQKWYQAAMVLEAENQALRDLLSLGEVPNTESISARVTQDTENSFYKTLLVLSGSEQGIKAGDAVVSGFGLIGRVIEVGRRSSRVLLLSDINSRVPVQIKNTGEYAILKGSNDEDPVLTFLSDSAVLEPGSMLITSGHGDFFPVGIPIGEVFYDEDKKPRVALLTDVRTLTHVRIFKRIRDITE